MSSAVILATAGYDHKIRFWEAPTGVCSRSLRYPDSQARAHPVTVIERHCSICLRVYYYTDDALIGSPRLLNPPPPPHCISPQVNCLQITPDKQFVAAAGNPHVRLFEVGGNANPNPVRRHAYMRAWAWASIDRRRRWLRPRGWLTQPVDIVR